MRLKLDAYVKSIPSPFQSQFAMDPERAFRRGKITKKILIETMVFLVSGTNMTGAAIALMEVFANSRNQMPPWTSSFWGARKRISWLWFRELFDSLLRHCDDQMTTFSGLRIFAVDGQQLQLQRTPDLVDNGFNGRRTGGYKETYLPRGFLVSVFDVINGVSMGLTFNPTLHEQKDARLYSEILHFVQKVGAPGFDIPCW